MIKGNIYNIMTGSLSDVSHIAEIAVNCIHKWNMLNFNNRGVALVPHHWTSSSYPLLGNSAQSIINSQIVDRSDALVAIFGSRLGTPTANHLSGTVEEIEQHRKANKPVMVFFCSNYNANIDIQNLHRIHDFRNSLEAEGLYMMYSDAADFQLKFSEKLSLFAQNQLSSEQNNDPTLQERQVSFSEGEATIMKMWSKGKPYLSVHTFVGGTNAFSFGGKMIQTETPR